MKKIVAFISFFVAAQCCVAQTSTADSVKQTVQTFFKAMYQSDSALLQQTLSPMPVFQTIMKDKAGTVKVVTEDVAAFIKTIASLPKQSADEQIVFETIKIDGDLAMVWTPYKFYFKQQFSHCGVNAFHLVRLNHAWKIQYIIDTRRKKDCL